MIHQGIYMTTTVIIPIKTITEKSPMKPGTSAGVLDVVDKFMKNYK